MARKVNTISRFNVTSLALGLAFLYLPIVILVIYSFNASRLVTVWGGWSLRWYAEFFTNKDWPVASAAAIVLLVVLLVPLLLYERLQKRQLEQGR